jgi:hypothetical protein
MAGKPSSRQPVTQLGRGQPCFSFLGGPQQTRHMTFLIAGFRFRFIEWLCSASRASGSRRSESVVNSKAHDIVCELGLRRDGPGNGRCP